MNVIINIQNDILESNNINMGTFSVEGTFWNWAFYSVHFSRMNSFYKKFNHLPDNEEETILRDETKLIVIEIVEKTIGNRGEDHKFSTSDCELIYESIIQWVIDNTDSTKYMGI